MSVTPGNESQIGVDGPPNPEHLTNHMLAPEQPDGSPALGLDVFYGIVHETEQLPDHTAFPDAIPDYPVDIAHEVNRYARGDMSQPVSQQAANQTITFTYHLSTTDPAMRILARDPDRKLARVSVCADDFTTTGTFAVYVSGSPLQNSPQGIGGFQTPGSASVMTSANAGSMTLPVSSKDELWGVLDGASNKNVYVSVYIERY